MENKIAKILSILYILFISIFALDSQSVIGFFIHLIPTYVLIVILLIALKKPRIGALLFFLLFILFTFFFHTYRSPMIFAMISFPLFTISLLFYKKL